VSAAAANGTALAVVERSAASVASIEPTNMVELERLAKHAATSGFFGAKSPEQALLVMMAGRDLGLSYSQALRAFHVIEGRPTLSADGMVATCLVRRDVCERFVTIEVTNDKATVETKRVGQDAQRYTFSMQDAQRAGVASKGTWAKYPSRMLLARARAALARDVYPDLLLGLYDPDELEGVSAPAGARADVIVEPTPAPAAVKAACTKVDAAPKVETPPHAPMGDRIATFREQFEKIGRDGSAEDLNALVAAVVKARLSSEERNALTDAYRAAQDAIKGRAAKADPEAEEAERAIAAKDGAA
jgi:hypothetical protein